MLPPILFAFVIASSALRPFQGAPLGLRWRQQEYLAAKRDLWSHPPGTPDEWPRYQAILDRFDALRERLQSKAPTQHSWDTFRDGRFLLEQDLAGLDQHHPIDLPKIHEAVNAFNDRQAFQRYALRELRASGIIESLASLPDDAVYIDPAPPDCLADFMLQISRSQRTRVFVESILLAAEDSVPQDQADDELLVIQATIRFSRIFARSGSSDAARTGAWMVSRAIRRAIWLTAKGVFSAEHLTALEALSKDRTLVPPFDLVLDSEMVNFKGGLDQFFTRNSRGEGRVTFESMQLFAVLNKQRETDVAWSAVDSYVLANRSPSLADIESTADQCRRLVRTWHNLHERPRHDVQGWPDVYLDPRQINFGKFDRFAPWRSPAESYDWLHQAQQALAIAIALERFKQDHQELPITLHDLVPTYLASVPIDPVHGHPFRYFRCCLRAGLGYTLYTDGEDGKDDGGVPVATRRGEPADNVIFPHPDLP